MGKIVWNLNIKKKIQHFIWKVYHDRIAVGSNLKKNDEWCLMIFVDNVEKVLKPLNTSFFTVKKPN